MRKSKPKSEFFVSKSTTSKIQELRIAKEVGGRRNPVSGAPLGFKGDVETRRFLIEAKTTARRRFSLTEKILAKIDSQAVNYGKIPALVIEFPTFRFGITKSWVLIPYPVFVKVVRVLDNSQEL